METTAFDFSLYVGKIGIDNLLLMVVGVLFGTLYLLKRQEGRYDRITVYLYSAYFFLVFGFYHDLYRFKPLRGLLLVNFSFAPYRTAILLISLLPLYFKLTSSIVKLLLARRARRKTERLTAQK